MKRIHGKLDFSKDKNFCSTKINIKRMRKQATDWEKISAKDISDKDCYPKYIKELLKLNSKKTNNLIKKWVKDLYRHLTKQDLNNL